MIWGSQIVLEMLDAAPGAGLKFDQIAAAGTAAGNGLEWSLRRLRRRGLVELDARRYRLTAAGRAFLAAGKRLTSGPRGPIAAKRLVKNTLRERVWRAIRIRRKFSAFEIIPLAASGTERDAEGNVCKYLRVLARSGFLAQLPTRRRGDSRAGSGYKRYLLVRDTGPQAPRWLPVRGIVYDPNTTEEHRP